MDNYSDGLASGLAIGQNCNGGYGNAFGYGYEWIWIIILFALWNNGGWGFGNNGGGGVGGEIQRGFDTASITTKLDGITNGICDGFYAMNTSMLNGFSNINTAIMQNGYETRNAINGVSTQVASCCCDVERGLDNVNYNMAKNTCDITNTINSTTRDIIDSQRDGTAAILNFLTQDKIASLTAENQSLKFAASQASQNAFIAANQDAQTAELIRRLGRDVPSPAYLVPNPNCCYNYGYGSCGGNPCGASVQ